MNNQQQRKISKNRGNDTHTRNVENNKFQTQSTESYEIMTGEVFFNFVEPAFRQNAVSVRLSQGGNISPVGIPGGFIDPITGNLHGNYEGLIPGQMVSVGFINGNSAAPVILNKYPYQGVGNTLTASAFITPMFLAGYDSSDTLMGHFSGSVIGLYTGLNPLGGRLPGSIGIDAFTACDITAQTDILLDALVSAEVKSALIKLTGSVKVEVAAPQVKIDGSATVEINGNTKSFVTHTELNTALQSAITLMNTNFDNLVISLDTGSNSGGSVVFATPFVATAVTLDIAAAKTTKTLCGS
jgi:hypothetical protein